MPGVTGTWDVSLSTDQFYPQVDQLRDRSNQEIDSLGREEERFDFGYESDDCLRNRRDSRTDRRSQAVGYGSWSSHQNDGR